LQANKKLYSETISTINQIKNQPKFTKKVLLHKLIKKQCTRNLFAVNNSNPNHFLSTKSTILLDGNVLINSANVCILFRWNYHPRMLGDDMIHIEISHCGVCGSDLHVMDAGWQGKDGQIGFVPTIYPVVVGHEIIGKIIAKGKQVTQFEIGQRVGVGAQAFACLQDNCGAW
jgi:hypothetical protein